MTTEVLTFPNDKTPLDLLLFRRFRREVPGLVEQTLANNYGLADLGVFPPAGTKVLVITPTPISSPAAARPVIQLYA